MFNAIWPNIRLQLIKIVGTDEFTDFSAHLCSALKKYKFDDYFCIRCVVAFLEKTTIDENKELM